MKRVNKDLVVLSVMGVLGFGMLIGLAIVSLITLI